jgi:serine/threonine protein kinase
MPLSVGDKLGPYEILAPVGKGGMGEVWKAHDTRLDRIVTVKISQGNFDERFEREARAVAALNRPRWRLYEKEFNSFGLVTSCPPQRRSERGKVRDLPPHLTISLEASWFD